MDRSSESSSTQCWLECWHDDARVTTVMTRSKNEGRTGANLYGHTLLSLSIELQPLHRAPTASWAAEIVSKPCETTDSVLAVRGPCMSSDPEVGVMTGGGSRYRENRATRRLG